MSYWHTEMDEATARKVLGSDFFDRAVSLGSGHCMARRAGWWDANDPEMYAAYGCAARMAGGES